MCISPTRGQVLAPAAGKAVITSHMLPILLRLVDDPVPNIRFNVAKTLQQIIPLVLHCSHGSASGSLR